MFCSNCGAKLEEGTVFCPKCGTKVEELGSHVPIDTPASSNDSRTVAYAVGDGVVSQYASFWQRAGAYIIDMVIVNIIAFGSGILLVVLGGAGIVSDEGFANLTGFIIGWLYFAILQSSQWQATFGKRALGLKVVDKNYNRIGFGRATVRFFSKILSILILFMGFIMVLFTKKRQGLHDMIAGTYVLSK